ncbi:hypothetical protein [Cohnella rhizosphaerae]|uniref:Uncharacterized protein n=1 Tax=Cohnella rhizosphaerae TaxID=1457232 RepID=A0A9X4KYJ3_9BACL|nr:hypothetical protein [Cohnella rhizosphaerae]MDG0812843.1 hypothetical protein [Cohnella rhizosphaerae]
MIAYIAAYALIGTIWTIVRLTALLEGRKNKEAAVYGGTMVISLVIGSLLLARVKLPSFAMAAQWLLAPVGHFLLRQ